MFGFPVQDEESSQNVQDNYETLTKSTPPQSPQRRKDFKSSLENLSKEDLITRLKSSLENLSKEDLITRLLRLYDENSKLKSNEPNKIYSKSSDESNTKLPLCMPVFGGDSAGKITSIKKWDYQNGVRVSIEDMNEAIYSVKREIAAIQVQMEWLKSQTEDLEKKQRLMLKWGHEKKSWYEDCVDLFDYR